MLRIAASFLSICLAGLFFNITQARANWAKIEDAEYIVDSERDDLSVNGDGNYEMIRDQVITIVKEGARGAIGSRTITYNPKESKVEILNAETINGDQITQVDRDYIEDKPLASNSSGFDSNNQILIAFPKINLNSKTHLRYKETYKKTPIANFFAIRFYLGLNGYLKTFSVNIKSKKQMFIQVNDPLKSLEVKEGKSESSFNFEIKSVKPIFSYVINENDSILSEKTKTWFAVSTSKEYSENWTEFAKNYEKVLSKPLPPLYEKIYEKAKREGKTDVEKFNLVTSELAQEVRYMGDWRPIEGGYVPRDLNLVAETKFGDCKDFATGTTAILRKLGYKAYVSLVERGTKPTPLPQLPLNGFNHAILRVETKDRSYWLDPTNFSSFAPGIFEDIAERESLVLDPQNVRLEKIESEGPKGSTKHYLQNISLYTDGDMRIDANNKFTGRVAQSLTGSDTLVSKEQFRHLIVNALVPEPDVKEYSFEPFDLTSRIVKDFEIKLHILARNSPVRTTAGLAYKLAVPDNFWPIFNVDQKTRVSDLNLSYPKTEYLETVLNNVDLIGSPLQGCDIKSPWLDASLFNLKKQNKAIAKISIVTKMRIIPVSDLKSEEFAKFQKKIKDCFEATAIVYRPNGKKQRNSVNSSL